MKQTLIALSILISVILLLNDIALADQLNSSGAKKSARALDLNPTKKSMTAASHSKIRDDGYERIDMSQFKEFEISTSKTAVKSICTTKSGIKYKQNQTGFDNCLRQAELEKSSQHSPPDPNSTSVGIEYGDDN